MAILNMHPYGGAQLAHLARMPAEPQRIAIAGLTAALARR
jgi:hypothetical protein